MEDTQEIDWQPYARAAQLAASNDPIGLLAALQTITARPDVVVANLRRLRLGQLVLRTLEAGSADDPFVHRLRAAMDGAGTRPPISAREHLRAFDEIRTTLEAAGIPVLLLKGSVLAQALYGGLDHRPQHDIDVLVRGEHGAKARRLVRRLGYRRNARDSHSVTYQRDAGKVDLHHALRSAPAYRIDEDAAWHAAREVSIAGTTVRTLADDDTLSLLTTSLLEDVGFGMAKLRSVCDVWLLARALDATNDWDAWFERRAAENLEAIAVNASALAFVALDARADAPRLAAAIDARAVLLRVRDQQQALALLTGTRGAAENRAWFGSVYPGSLLRYRVQTFVAGLPATWRDRRRAD